MPNPEKTIDNCIQMLQHIMDDSTIPRNIRRVADETRQLLLNQNKGTGLRAAEAISKIDEISKTRTCRFTHGRVSGSWSPSLRPFPWTERRIPAFMKMASPFSFFARSHIDFR